MSRGLGPTRSTAPSMVQAKDKDDARMLIFRRKEVWLCPLLLTSPLILAAMMQHSRSLLMRNSCYSSLVSSTMFSSLKTLFETKSISCNLAANLIRSCTYPMMMVFSLTNVSNIYCSPSPLPASAVEATRLWFASVSPRFFLILASMPRNGFSKRSMLSAIVLLSVSLSFCLNFFY